MSKQDLKQEIRDLIINDRTEQAIERLSNVQFSRVDKELIILNSQFNRVKEDLRMNVISRDEAERKINNINKSLLELAESVQKGDKDLASVLAQRASGKAGPQKLWPLLLIPFLVFGIYWITSKGESNTENNDQEGASVVDQDSIDRYQSDLERKQDSIQTFEQDQLAAQRRQDSIADYARRNPPPPTIMKVKFVLRQLEVIKDGDSLDDGDFTWTFRVNGQIIESRTSEFNLGNEDKKTFNREYAINLPINSGTINFDASIVEVDGGFNGSNDFINISSTYSNSFLKGLAVGQIRNDSKVGTPSNSNDPEVRVHWSVIRIE
ncbi:MAG: hypothetical protein AAGF87_00330 [Bacteroidota bacterium]